MPNYDALATRFVELWNRNTDSMDPAMGRSVWLDVLRRYQEPHRHYHSLVHINFCLQQFDKVAELIPTPDAVEFAIWFHDVIYVIGAKDNEARSRDYFCEVANNCMPPGLVVHVADLIMATTHFDDVKNTDEEYMVDIDLSSFGLPWNEFIADSNALRLESPDTHDEHFYRGKLRFFRALESRDRIFYSDWFYQDCEQVARENIGRFSAQLVGEGYSV